MPKPYSDEKIRTKNNTYLRKINSFCIEVYKPLLGKLVLRQQDAETILRELPAILEKPFAEKEIRTIELSVEGPPITVKQRAFGDQKVYGVTFSCNDLWWFSEEEIEELRQALKQVCEI
jgi:hypothetical protein